MEGQSEPGRLLPCARRRGDCFASTGSTRRARLSPRRLLSGSDIRQRTALDRDRRAPGRRWARRSLSRRSPSARRVERRRLTAARGCSRPPAPLDRTSRPLRAPSTRGLAGPCGPSHRAAAPLPRPLSARNSTDRPHEVASARRSAERAAKARCRKMWCSAPLLALAYSGLPSTLGPALGNSPSPPSSRGTGGGAQQFLWGSK